MDTNEEQHKLEATESKKSDKKKWLIILLIILLILAIGGVNWWLTSKCNDEKQQKDAQISQLEQDKKDLQKQLDEEKAKQASASDSSDETACKTPSSSDVENIKASITSGNTAALEGYMATKVTVILAASEGIGERTPTQAIGDIDSFISDTTSWNFALPAATLNAYSSGFYTKYFPDGAVVGKANNKKVISFSFDCDGKIKTVFLSASSDIL